MPREQHRSILVPLDGSSLAEGAIPPAITLATTSGLGVTLLHVIASADRKIDPRLDQERVDATRYLAGVAGRLADWGIPTTSEIHSGNAAEAILQHIRTSQAKLVIMTTHGRSGFGRWLYGSVAEAVLSHASAPILLIRSAWPTVQLAEASAYCRIVVPLDGSARAEAAIPVAVRIAHWLNGIVVLVRAIAPVPALVASRRQSVSTSSPAASVRAEAEASLNRAIALLVKEGVRARSRLVEREPVEAILETCYQENAALLVMTTHGRTGLRRLAFGSTAVEVLHRGQTPVLFVRPADIHG